MPNGEWRIDPGSAELVRTLIRRIVNLRLKEFYHYIDWVDKTDRAQEEQQPVEGFESETITQVLPVLTLVWEWETTSSRHDRQRGWTDMATQ